MKSLSANGSQVCGSGGKLADLEKELSEREKEEAKAMAKMKSGKENVASEEKKKKQLEKSIKDDEAALKEKEKVLSKAEDVFLRLRQADEEDSKALEADQRKYQVVSSGLLSSDDGQDATLQDQLLNAKQEVSRLQTESMQCNMQLEHNRNELKIKQKDLKQGETDYARDEKQLQSMDKELESLRRYLGKVNYEEGKLEDLEDRKRQLNTDIRKMRDKVEQFQARNSSLRSNYKNPKPNFDRSAVKGLVCQLFKVKDPKFAMALESAAGGRVRAGSLQELVYKSGQAGVTKASVTITFDNRDTSKSPLGYEKYDEITVTRQTVVDRQNIDDVSVLSCVLLLFGFQLISVVFQLHVTLHRLCLQPANLLFSIHQLVLQCSVLSVV
ncbi:structural maintenance of chromosomes protein 2-like [Macrosteles quadrilineatus]|uniref:structural maintenance of chromosomes protein 2-like n=1 Tax=Macrosteles quadrilineatus TaxID=74068 RepID=UPI0023E1E7C0|nr:structural maintenance of chromosomes protein 2-like [Macrosteles quadrilineatus]